MERRVKEQLRQTADTPIPQYVWGPDVSDMLQAVASRHWVCFVVRTSYHNGAKCSESDPHGDDWRCGWRNELSLDDEAWKTLIWRVSGGK